MTESPEVDIGEINDKARRRDEVLSCFVFREPTNFFAGLDAAIAGRAGEIVDHAKTLRRNLDAAISVASIPFVMAHAGVVDRRFQAILSAERIRQLQFVEPEAGLSEKHESAAHKIASERLHTELEAEDGRRRQSDQILNDLGNHLDNAEFKAAAAELLRQTLVMVWGAFEVFASDTIISLLNRDPILAAKLLSGDVTKRHFPQRGVTIESLEAHGFDVGNSMGDVLFSERQIDSLPLIRDILTVIMPAQVEFHKLLASTELWTLWQRRHLIVHHRGIVDKSYITKTPDKFAIGTQIEFNSDDIDAAFVLVRDVSVGLIEAVARGSS